MTRGKGKRRKKEKRKGREKEEKRRRKVKFQAIALKLEFVQLIVGFAKVDRVFIELESLISMHLQSISVEPIVA